ncbi:MAG: hypothetical protein GXO09_06090 [Crenarchaeota archaeon]|nr:hypothetical protein [Thermoproteota archaeon]
MEWRRLLPPILIALLLLPAAPALGLGFKPTAHVVVKAFYPSMRLNKLLSSLPGGYMESPRAMPSGACSPPHGDLMVIIVPANATSETMKLVGRLASMHQSMGLRVVVYDTGYIARHYKPAPPPPFSVNASRIKGFNETLSEAIIAFERSMLGRGLHYLLIVGSASEVPPSAYYHSAVGGEVGRWFSLVPTDYFYMDPDYDWCPEVAVGRIPFSNATLLKNYIDALNAWMSRAATNSISLVYAGGAPFAWTLMTGDTYASMLSTAGLTDGFRSVSFHTLTLGNMAGKKILSSIGPGTVFIPFMHGSGKSFVDYEPRGALGSAYTDLLTRKDFASAESPMLVITPACINAAWDTRLLKPPFNPPSMAEYLLSHGKAAAYLGSSRISVLLIGGVDIERGLVSLDLHGVVELQMLTLRNLYKTGRLGDAFATAAAEYLRDRKAHYVITTTQGWDDLAVLNLLEQELLGTPALPVPLSGHGSVSKPYIKAPEWLDARLFYPMEYDIVSGSVPFSKPDETIMASVGGDAKIVSMRRVYSEYLVGLRPSPVNSTAIASPDVSGLLSIGVVDGKHYYHFIAARGGLLVSSRGVTAYGLSLLSITGDQPVEVLVDGKMVSILPGGVDYAALPVEAGTMTVKPFMYSPGLVVEGVGRSVEKLVKAFTVTIGSPGGGEGLKSILPPGGRVGERVGEAAPGFNILVPLLLLLVVAEAGVLAGLRLRRG